MLTISIPSFRRSYNLPYLYDFYMKHPLVDEVIIWYEDPPDDRGVHRSVINQLPEPPEGKSRKLIFRPGMPVGMRYHHTIKAKNEYVVSLDDDIFLREDQVTKIHEAFEQGYRMFSPHGITWSIDGKRERTVSSRNDCAALVHVYCYHRDAAQYYDDFLETLGLDPMEVTNGEDILLSFAYRAATGSWPKVIPLGMIRMCVTGVAPKVATHKVWEKEFIPYRAELVRKILKQLNLTFEDLPQGDGRRVMRRWGILEDGVVAERKSPYSTGVYE